MYPATKPIAMPTQLYLFHPETYASASDTTVDTAEDAVFAAVEASETTVLIVGFAINNLKFL